MVRHLVEVKHLKKKFTVDKVAYFWSETKANDMLACRVDEGGKAANGITAPILAARKLARYDCGRRVPATAAAIADAARWAEEITRAIDERFQGTEDFVTVMPPVESPEGRD